jgi:uncharacterized RDD family membrane protein YckC
MIDPDLTNVMKRRITASIVDLAFTGLGTLAVWWSQLITFPFTDRYPITNAPTFDAEQTARLNQIASQPLNAYFDTANARHVIDQQGIVLTGLFAIVLATVVFVLLPTNSGSSPGQRLLGLRVVDTDAKTPGLAACLVRTSVGVIDAVPFVVPGLLGWLVARNDEFHRRLGDRVAGTTVIDARRPVKLIDAALFARRNELRRVALDDADDGSMVQIDDRIGLAAPGDQVGVEGTGPKLLALAGGATDLFDAVAPSRFEAAPAGAVPGPAAPSPAAPSPAAPSPMTLDSAPPESHERRARPEGTTRPVPKPTHRAPVPDEAWERPIPEPAPVWHPGMAERSVPQPSPSPGRSIGSPSPEYEPTDRIATVQTVSVETPRFDTSAATPATGEPATAPTTGTVWNDQWQAWLFWDAPNHRWLRHDTDADEWIPIS